MRPFSDALCTPVRHPDGTPLVSAIILNRNGAALLHTLLSSFHRVNRYPAIEIIIVDHGSSDDTQRVVEAWARRLPVVLVPCRENYSFSYSCNRAAERAGGQFLLLLNNDIEFSEDIIGRMAAAAQESRGVVGIKLFRTGSSTVYARPPSHIGVRFRWHPKQRRLVPYNAMPNAGDAAIQASPAHFPAVTAALMMCPRDEYLALGGLDEAFVYGYEDLDLCLKFRFRLSRPVICLNDLSAIHREGSSRRVQVSQSTRRLRLHANAAAFDRRWGYRLRREAVLKLFVDDGCYWGRRVRLGFAAGDEAWAEVGPLAAAVAARYGWSVCRLRRWHAIDKAALDLLIVVDPAMGAGVWRHRCPGTLAAAWQLKMASLSQYGDISGYDFLLAGDADLAAIVRQSTGLPVTVIAPDAAGADALLAAIVGHLRDHHRFLLKSPVDFDRGCAGIVSGLLRRAGHSVRIDLPGSRQSRERLHDDVVILFGGAPCPRPQPGAINLACWDWPGDQAVDARLARGDARSLAAAILADVARLHPLRMLGPQDEPLQAHAFEPDDLAEGWSHRPDAALCA